MIDDKWWNGKYGIHEFLDDHRDDRGLSPPFSDLHLGELTDEPEFSQSWVVVFCWAFDDEPGGK